RSGGARMKLVQMPTELLHLDDADLDKAGIDAGLLTVFRMYLPRALGDARGLAILAPPAAGSRQLLMVLARRIGVALRDENIRLRERGGNLKAGRKKLCYLPGSTLSAALADLAGHCALTTEAACFVQDLDQTWPDLDTAGAGSPPVAGPVD